MKPIVMIFFAIVIGIIMYYVFRPFTASDVRSYTWVPDICSESTQLDNYCEGIHSFDSKTCMIKNDGYIYHNNQIVAKFLEGEHPPFLREAAPRTGGSFNFVYLATGKECTFDTTD